MRLWLAMAVVAAVAVCLYALFLGFAAGSAVAAWVPVAPGAVGGAPVALTGHPVPARPSGGPGPRRARPAAAAVAPPPEPSAGPGRPAPDSARPPRGIGAAPRPLGRTVRVGADPRPGPAPLLLPSGGQDSAWLDETIFRQALARRLAALRPGLAQATRSSWVRQIALRAVAWHLNPWLVFAVIDVESGFQPDTVGQAGEIGLMQVLPSTGAVVARRTLGIRRFEASELFEPAWNIRIGTAYLGGLVQNFDGNVPVALAAYNAGDSVHAPTGYSWLVLSRLRRLSGAS